MTDPVTIVWFERDLRLADNAALSAAIAGGGPVLPVFILDEDVALDWHPGGASRWWLHHALAGLARDLARIGLPLVLRPGPTQTAIQDLAAETGAGAVLWNRRYEPATWKRDEAVAAALAKAGIAAQSHAGALLHEPWAVKTGSGRPYSVFTPFWRALRALGGPGSPLPAPTAAAAPGHVPAGLELAGFGLLPTRPDWAGGLRRAWQPGEKGARRQLAQFLDEALRDYRAGRDRPDRPGTSMLSPHLHFGEVSPRTIWAAVDAAMAVDPALAAPGEAYLRELGWRDFCHQLAFHHGDMARAPLRPEFAAFPWRDDPAGLAAWQRGQTGYPIVDAGMRQLWQTGWMHNRVRMVAASFLVKDLLVPWQAGEAWFRDTLVDADLANNAANWQWVAGCGADASPFFRIFNPVLQGRKFDPDGAYVRRFVPELTRLPDRWLHQPWTAPDAVLDTAGIRLGRDYPRPIVDHAMARERALEALAEAKAAYARSAKAGA